MKNKFEKLQERMELRFSEIICSIYVNQAAFIVHLHDKEVIDADEYLNVLRSSIKGMSTDETTPEMALSGFNYLADILDEHIKNSKENDCG